MEKYYNLNIVGNPDFYNDEIISSLINFKTIRRSGKIYNICELKNIIQQSSYLVNPHVFGKPEIKNVDIYNPIDIIVRKCEDGTLEDVITGRRFNSSINNISFVESEEVPDSIVLNTLKSLKDENMARYVASLNRLLSRINELNKNKVLAR